MGKILSGESTKPWAIGGVQPSIWHWHILVNFFLSEVFSSVDSFYLWVFFFLFDKTPIYCYISVFKSMRKVIYFANSCFSLAFFFAMHWFFKVQTLCFLKNIRFLQYTIIFPHRINVKLNSVSS